MVEENSFSYYSYHYNIILKVSSQFGDYTEFKNRYQQIISKKPIDEQVCTKFLIKFFKKVLEDGIKFFLSMIEKENHLKLKSGEEIEKLKEIKEKILLNDLELVDLYQLTRDANKYLLRIYDKREIIELTKREKWKERAIGFVTALVIAIIVWILSRFTTST